MHQLRLQKIITVLQSFFYIRLIVLGDLGLAILDLGHTVLVRVPYLYVYRTVSRRSDGAGPHLVLARLGCGLSLLLGQRGGGC